MAGATQPVVGPRIAVGGSRVGWTGPSCHRSWPRRRWDGCKRRVIGWPGERDGCHAAPARLDERTRWYTWRRRRHRSARRVGLPIEPSVGRSSRTARWAQSSGRQVRRSGRSAEALTCAIASAVRLAKSRARC